MRRVLGSGSHGLGCLVVGGGPAALAPLVAASRQGSLAKLLANGVAVVERSASIGAGRLGSYVIWSDSTADSFLTAVKDHRDPRLSTIASSALCDRLRAIGYGAISLADAASLQREVGQTLQQAITDGGGQVHVEHEALWARKTSHGWQTRVKPVNSNKVFDIDSRSLVIGTGGYQPTSQLSDELVAGAPLVPRFADKVIQSDTALRPCGLKAIAARLAGNPSPKVAIVGGSTSAVAAADLLLKTFPDRWSHGAITIMHRRPLRVFFHSVADARQKGYTDFEDADVCPVTGFVYRLAGLRQHSKDLLVRCMGIGSARDEYRLDLHQIREHDVAQHVLDKADLIVAALGYRPRGFSLFDEKGVPIPLRGVGSDGHLVDEQCRVVALDGRPIDGVFGIGLASGFQLDAAMGGEPSFKGQANGLWLWQNNIGMRVVEGIFDQCRAEIPLARHADLGALLAQGHSKAPEVLPL